MIWRNFEEAREFARSLNLKNRDEWRQFAKSLHKPMDIPRNVDDAYAKHGWICWADWLGVEGTATNRKLMMPFVDARAFVRGLNLKNKGEWVEYCRSGNKPNTIPNHPDRSYAKMGWVNFHNWLNEPKKGRPKKVYLPFEEARDFVHSLKLQNRCDWKTYMASSKRNPMIPVNPHLVYPEFKGLNDWLGLKRVARGSKFLPFEEAREFVKKLGIEGTFGWLSYVKSGKKPDNIPSSPWLVYRNLGWSGFGDWTGNSTEYRLRKNKLLSFEEARNLVWDKGFSGQKEWRENFDWCRENKIPTNPDKTYGNKWLGWGDWFGTQSFVDRKQCKKLLTDILSFPYTEINKYVVADCILDILEKNGIELPNDLRQNLHKDSDDETISKLGVL